MFSHSPARDAAAALNETGAITTTKPFRVAAITITDSPFKASLRGVQEEEPAALLWGTLDHCVIPAGQRARAHTFFDGGADVDIPAALLTISILLAWRPPINTSILGPLATDYPALVRSLRVLTIACNRRDDSADLGAFAALALQLREITFLNCGISSIRGLEGHCEYLRKVNLCGCVRLKSIDALSDHPCLEEVDASHAPITSIESLRSCPALTKVVLNECRQLSTIQGLEGHRWLQVVDASATAIRSIEPLRTCPALTIVQLNSCRQLDSIQELEHHVYLQEVDASETTITSIESLRTCPALTKVHLFNCQDLYSIKALNDHQWLQEVDISDTPISLLEPLSTCFLSLRKLVLKHCEQFESADIDFPASVDVIR